MIQSKKFKSVEYFNKKARFDYVIEESIEAGIVLTGLEIKAIRSGRVNMTSSYAKIIGGEIFWLGGVIEVLSGDKQRTRKLLLKMTEIKKLIGKTEEKGLALVPIKLYLKRGRAKLELGIGRGKKKYDKRAAEKEKDIERDINISLKDTRYKSQ